MKRFISALVILAVSCLLIGQVFAASAASYATNNDKQILTLVLDSSSLNCTAVNQTATNASAIVPGVHRILGYEVAPRVSGAGTVTVSLYDNATTAGANAGTGLFAETVTTTTASADRVFIYPKQLSNGLAVVQGAGTTVTIYYERNQP